MNAVPEALRAVWLAQRDRVLVRVGVIERALAALAGGALDESTRVEAQRAAHMLAGSVGTFGFMRASDAAAGLDRAFDDPAREDDADLTGLLAVIRTELEQDG